MFWNGIKKCSFPVALFVVRFFLVPFDSWSNLARKGYPFLEESRTWSELEKNNPKPS